MDGTAAGSRLAPVFALSTTWETTLTYYIGGDDPLDLSDGGFYAWVCLEEASDDPTGVWRGSVFAHVDAVDGAPDDAFMTFDDADCTGREEDAGDDWSTEGCWTPADCDGVDNDMDGIIDEGADDHDGDGVPDCLPCGG
jgi:hypothetical protein